MSAAATLSLMLAAAVAQAQEDGPFESEIRAFEAADRASPPPRGGVVFVGSSSIRLWKTLAADFPRHAVINRGFGGSQIAHAVRYVDRIVTPYAPRLVVMYAGGNDIHAGKEPAAVAADFEAFVRAVHARVPAARVAYISVAPNPARWAEVERVKELNRRVAAFARTDRRLSFIDVFPHMLGPDGQPRPEIFVADRLHMNDKGYALWTRIVGPRLDALVKVRRGRDGAPVAPSPQPR
jgi:lysophospholipase L1-like esterase